MTDDGSDNRNGNECGSIDDNNDGVVVDGDDGHQDSDNGDDVDGNENYNNE